MTVTVLLWKNKCWNINAKSEKAIEIIEGYFHTSTVPRHSTGTVPGRDNMKGIFYVPINASPSGGWGGGWRRYPGN